MGVKEAVVARFREIFDQRNMRPNELAYRSGVTPSTVYSMLYGRRREVAIQPDQEALRRAGHEPGRVLQRTGI